MKLQHKRSRGKHRNADCADGDEARKRMQAERMRMQATARVLRAPWE